ncbi:MAG: BMP family protein [Fimbriimonadaceae bacterium]|nr:BMP family protein [Fimbriimonadaceae bacterium]QYK59702.1 MAG: BMP family protein [Fimbriimonadaceae bacterium]
MKTVALAGAALAFLAWGCEPSAPEARVAQGDLQRSFRVALLTPGPVSDAGWNAMAFRGLQAIQKDLGATVNNQETSETKIRDAMRSYAQEGYDLVFGHGFEYNEPAVEVAKDFPKTVFVSSSGGKTAPNAGAFRFALEEGFYVAGYVSGMMTKTGKVAMIGGPDVPSIRSTFKAFRAGAERAKPGVQVIETFTGKDADVAAAKQATLAAIGQGADFVVHQANAAAQGVFDACKEKGVAAFGANLDQNDNASGVVLGSAVINAEPAFLGLAKSVKEGTYQGGIEVYGMKQGAIDFVWNPNLASKVPAMVQEMVERLKGDITSGKLSVPMDQF